MVTQMVGVLSRGLLEWVCLCGGSSQCAKERTHKHIHENTPSRATPLTQHHRHVTNPSAPHSRHHKNTANLLSSLHMPHGQSPPHLQSKLTSRPYSFPQTHHVYLTISERFHCFENHSVMEYNMNTWIAAVDSFWVPYQRWQRDLKIYFLTHTRARAHTHTHTHTNTHTNTLFRNLLKMEFS